MIDTLPNFVDDDPQAITAELIAHYEAMTGKTLYPAHIDRIMIDLIASVAAQKSAEINDTGRLNLVSFSRGAILDYLGELVGTLRLDAKSAKTTLRFTFLSPLPAPLLIPAGTQAETSDGRAAFATEVDATAAQGASYIDVTAVAVTPGVAGNGWLPGQINTLIDDLVDVDSVANIAVTAGGADEESDDHYRERIKLAPEQFSVAGPVGAYRYHAMRASQDITDVAVVGPELALENGQLVSRNGVPPGVVRLYPLTRYGLPSEGLLAEVAARCSHTKARPLTDLVQVLAPQPVDYVVDAQLTLYTDADATSAGALLQAATEKHVSTLAAKLGRDIVPSQLVAALSLPGVYRVELLEPAAVRSLAPHEWARCTAINVRVTGRNDG